MKGDKDTKDEDFRSDCCNAGSYADTPLYRYYAVAAGGELKAVGRCAKCGEATEFHLEDEE